MKVGSSDQTYIVLLLFSLCNLDNSSMMNFVYGLWPLFPMQNSYIYMSKITENNGPQL